MMNIRTIAYCGVSLVSMLAFTPATAQESENEAAEDGVIIVEARRRSENLQDIPLVVNAVSSETLEKLSIRDFRDVTSVVPGLALTPNANGRMITKFNHSVIRGSGSMPMSRL